MGAAMGPRFTGWCAFALAGTLAFAPTRAQARDPKSQSLRVHEGFSAAVATHETHPIVLQQNALTSSAVRPVELSYSPANNKPTTKVHNTSPINERKPLTLFRFNSKLGEVAVQPVIGQIKGAQLS